MTNALLDNRQPPADATADTAAQDTARWLAVDGTEATVARDWLRTTLLDHDTDAALIDDAVLLTAELIGNVARHTDSRSVHLHVAPSHSSLTVTVGEQTSGTCPAERLPLLTAAPLPAVTATSGRGLAILDSLAHQWGVTRTHRTTSVWFTLTTADR